MKQKSAPQTRPQPVADAPVPPVEAKTDET